MTTLARTDDDRWLLVKTGPDSTGWVYADEAIVFNMSALPIVAGGTSNTVQAGAKTGSDAPTEPFSPDDISTADGLLASTETSTSGEASTDIEASSSVEAPPESPLTVPVPTKTVKLGTTSQPIDTDGSTSTVVSESVPVTSTGLATGATPVTGSGLVPSAIVAAGQMTATVDTDDALLNIRFGPSMDYAIINQAPPGTVLPALGRNQAATWIQITTPDLNCSAGWVSAQYIRLSEPIEALPVIEMDVVPPAISATGQMTATVGTEDDRLNIRCGPSTEYAIIGKALPGDVFPAAVRNDAETWMLISVADEPYAAGWVSAEYIRLSEPIELLPVVQVDYVPGAGIP